MFIRPHKSYGSKCVATLYKKYVSEVDVYSLHSETKEYYGVIVNNVVIGVYSFATNQKLSTAEQVEQLTHNNVLLMSEIGQVIYSSTQEKFIQLVKIKNEVPTFKFSKTLEGSLIDSVKLMESVQYDRYYKLKEFNAICYDDMDSTNLQYIKGATVVSKTLSLRWEVDLPIMKDDIIVINNIPYMAGDISVTPRRLPNLMKVYHTELTQQL